jgi:hypothetical protein
VCLCTWTKKRTWTKKLAMTKHLSEPLCLCESAVVFVKHIKTLDKLGQTLQKNGLGQKNGKKVIKKLLWDQKTEKKKIK